VKAPEELPGLDLRDREAMKARQKIMVEAYRHDIMDLADPVKSRTALTVIDGWMKLIVPSPVKPPESKWEFAALAAEIELFDLRNDPLELVNLADQKAEETVRLKALLEASYGAEQDL
jgi:hypothetical protein